MPDADGDPIWSDIPDGDEAARLLALALSDQFNHDCDESLVLAACAVLTRCWLHGWALLRMDTP